MKVLFRESPMKRLRILVLIVLKSHESLLDFIRARHVVGCEGLSLDDRVPDLDLVQPTGVDWQGYQPGVVIRRAEPLSGGFAPVRRTVVGDPENSIGGTVRLLSHDRIDQTLERFDPGLSAHSGRAPARWPRPRPPSRRPL